MTQLSEIKVKLSDNQKNNIARAYKNKETYILRLTNDSLLGGSEVLYVPANIAEKLQKHRRLNKGMDIKLSKTNIRKQVGSGIFSAVLPLVRTLGPTIGKTLGLSTLAGLASEGASQLVKKISGGQIGGFFIPDSKV